MGIVSLSDLYETVSDLPSLKVTSVVMKQKLRFLQFPEKIEPHHDKTKKVACAPSEDSDQPGHPPSLIRVFAVRVKKAWVLSYPLSAQRRLWSVWSSRLFWVFAGRACNFVGFVMRRLNWLIQKDDRSSASILRAFRWLFDWANL